VVARSLQSDESDLGVAPERSDHGSHSGPLATGGRRIALLIRSLDYGGAETQMTVLANGLARSGHSVSLLVMYQGGPLLERLSPAVKVRCLEKRGRWDVVGFFRRLFLVLADEKPDLLYAFMPVANLLACVARVHSPKLRVAWSVRASDVELTHYDWLSRLTYWIERRFSRFPDLIISNSMAGRRYAVSQGFPGNDRFIVIPNGIDVERFQPYPILREAVRAEWEITPKETLVGIVGRLDPMKDYPTFLQAAAILVGRKQGMRFVSVGVGPPDYVARLREQARRLGLEGKMIWAGPRGDLPSVYNALDLLVSSSAFGEGFSNVLGEAMACGVPCIATDVGDAREILGDAGVLVPRRNPEALADGIVALLDRLSFERVSLCAEVRHRISENFSMEKLVRRTKAALEAIP
jgi:glycosyltransferase involved in cell wall biosynthesis